MKPGKPLDRRSPLKAKSAPKPRATPIKKVNRKRKAKRHAEDFGPPGFVEFVHSYGCVVAQEKGPLSGCEGPSECAHRRSRAAGGTWRENCYPLCRKHHREQHDAGINTWEARYEIDGDLWAVAIYSRWLGVTQTKGDAL